MVDILVAMRDVLAWDRALLTAPTLSDRVSENTLVTQLLTG